MRLPLRHFFVALLFLLLGGFAGISNAIDVGSGMVLTAQLHLLLAGWVCITIMGAMTQFVPVWAGVNLHSRWLARWELRLVVLGILGVAAGLLMMQFEVVAIFAPVMLLGFWIFVYNIGRTLTQVETLDRTLRHFVASLAFFILLTVFGVSLAIDFRWPFLQEVGLNHWNVKLAHLTVAVFGAVLVTILGALYQLGTMFTQTELHGVDHYLAYFEEVTVAPGVLALAAGRLFGVELLATLGGLAIVLGVASFSIVLGRKLWEMRVPWTPMHRRYVVVATGMSLWALTTAPFWLSNPVSESTRFGGPLGAHLIGGLVIVFVIMGTLYHIIPFIIWVERYSELLGFEKVPMIDDLYLEKVANVDFILLVGGNLLLLGWELFGLHIGIGLLAILMVGAGILLFIGNMLYVVHQHGPDGVGMLLPDRFGPV